MDTTDKTKLRYTPWKWPTEISHIPGTRWGEMAKRGKQRRQQQEGAENSTPRKLHQNCTINIDSDLQQISKNSILRQEIEKRPKIHYWPTKTYTEQEIRREIQQPETNKSHGNDDTPGESFGSLHNWLLVPTQHIMHSKQTWHDIPTEWKQGTVSHIYKTKEARKTKNYRPIRLKQIVYEIWSALSPRSHAGILHLVTSTTRCGYKQGISTIDPARWAEQFAREHDPESKIILRDLAKSFGTIDRTQLWGTLYKKGLPLENIVQIR